jgi:hypothetical protein
MNTKTPIVLATEKDPGPRTLPVPSAFTPPPQGGGGGKRAAWMWVIVGIVIFGGLGYALSGTQVIAPLQGENEEVKEPTPSEEGFRPSFLWEFFPAGDDELGTPRTSVTLSINGEVHEVGTFDGSCLVVNGSSWELVENELTGVICWFAGGGDEVGVFYEEGEYVVKQGVLEEGAEGESGMRGSYETLFVL